MMVLNSKRGITPGDVNSAFIDCLLPRYDCVENSPPESELDLI